MQQWRTNCFWLRAPMAWRKDSTFYFRLQDWDHNSLTTETNTFFPQVGSHTGVGRGAPIVTYLRYLTLDLVSPQISQFALQTTWSNLSWQKCHKHDKITLCLCAYLMLFYKFWKTWIQSIASPVDRIIPCRHYENPSPFPSSEKKTDSCSCLLHQVPASPSPVPLQHHQMQWLSLQSYNLKQTHTHTQRKKSKPNHKE